MNVFRELRRIKNRNVIARLAVVFVFLLMLITSTYAWFNISKEVEIQGVEGKVSGWNVEYYVNDVFAENTYVFEAQNFYPGMDPITETVKIYNTGELNTNIKYEITSIKLFGEEILEQLENNNEIIYSERGIAIFTDTTKYPFFINYSYDKVKLIGTYADAESTPNAVATLDLSASWEYHGNDAKDILDTGFGEAAYDYYEAHPEGEEALVIEMKITSEMTNV